jgi:uncharacterized protein
MLSQKLAGAFEETTPVDVLVERCDAPRPCFPLLSSMFIERGSIDDWKALHELHYKAESLPMGARFWRLDLEGETIGVLVTAVPKLMLKERHLVFPQWKPGRDSKLVNTIRAKQINANLRVISRFVVDTMYRGIGCGYRMMNLASRMEGLPFMEIQSSMSKFNFFGERAGFRFVRPLNANKFEVGLKFFRSHFESSPQDFEAIVIELERHPPAARARLLAECKDFYYKHSALEKTGSNRGDKGVARVEAMTARETIKAIQQICLASPMYGVWKNPDHGRSLPARIPLTAFDLQAPTAPFRGDLNA